MRTVKIETLTLKIIGTGEEANYSIGCPFARDRDDRCYTTCAWFRIAKKQKVADPMKSGTINCAYCGDKLIGEIVEAKDV